MLLMSNTEQTRNQILIEYLGRRGRRRGLWRKYNTSLVSEGLRRQLEYRSILIYTSRYGHRSRGHLSPNKSKLLATNVHKKVRLNRFELCSTTVPMNGSPILHLVRTQNLTCGPVLHYHRTLNQTLVQESEPT